MNLIKLIEQVIGADFFCGVPDSLLKPLCDYLYETYGISHRHIVAANEGNCAAIAAGYHLATGKVPVVYMQNSGIGNAINPIVSLLNEGIYAIPCIFIIGWRGEPGVPDEPQHKYQGEITIKLLQDIGIDTVIIDATTSDEAIVAKLHEYKTALASGKSLAFVVKKDALSLGAKVQYKNVNTLSREDIIRKIAEIAGSDIVIATTGKTSRELYEVRESCAQGHESDFLTVGSMGHSSSIALGIALQKPKTKLWCLDGDGAVLMHMGALAVIGSLGPPNFVHVVINNCAHESVGGMPTVAGQIDLVRIAEGCGYRQVFKVYTADDLTEALRVAKAATELTFIEAMASVSSRANLGRPTTTTHENKESFMRRLRACE